MPEIALDNGHKLFIISGNKSNVLKCNLVYSNSNSIFAEPEWCCCKIEERNAKNLDIFSMNTLLFHGFSTTGTIFLFTPIYMHMYVSGDWTGLMHFCSRKKIISKWTSGVVAVAAWTTWKIDVLYIHVKSNSIYLT